MPRPSMKSLDAEMQELATIKKVVDTLKQMAPEARTRALTYVTALFAAESTSPAESMAAEAAE